MKIENQVMFMKNLINVDDEDVISLEEYFNGVGSGIYPRKNGCTEDCFDMHFLVLCELKRRGIYDSHRWRSKNVSDNDISIVLNKLDDGNIKKFTQESFYNIDFNGDDYKTMLSMIDEKIVDLDSEIDVLNDYRSNLLEFRDKVAYLSKN